jgi:hypothetical protein
MLFGDASTSPRAQHLEAGGRPYSPGTITMYKGVIKAHILTDSNFLQCAKKAYDF